MKPSLLRRMILAQGIVISLAWIVAWAIALGTLYWSKKGIFDDTLELTGAALASILQDETDPARFQLQARRIQDLDETYTRSSDLKPGEYKGIYQIFDREGRLLFRSASAPIAPLTTVGTGFQDVSIEGHHWRVFVKTDPAGRLRVIVAQPHAIARKMIWRSILKSPIEFAVAFVILALLTWLLSRRALKPLRELASAVAARSPGDLSPLEKHAGLRETKPLITALNRLFARVEDLLETQRRFVADAAHELRTPLAVIGAQAHVVQHALDGDEREMAAKDLQQGVARAAQLVGQLLSVARLDAASPSMERAPLDLARLAQDCVGLMVSQAVARQQDLGYEGPDSLPWHGNRPALVSAVDNLLANALRYTPEGGRITLRLARMRDAACIEVEDTGPGIPPEFRALAFERFSRLPGSAGSGSGLGLAIVRRAVELHGGIVTLDAGADGMGLKATIRLPG
ncbi:ATP-binding protein [uncultured Tolumonas sp.]|uniref:ATP-binding protein n=1 Tax=uncultured Tolumonas sp. TaxID=263765 RepID=UPI00292CC119|nr:ATP-binding protein [uncultured Tolumonas sp.]